MPLEGRKYIFYLETSTNSIASIFAWTRGLMHRATLDKNEALKKFCETLEKTVIQTVEDGFYTKDLAISVLGNTVTPKKDQYLYTEEFIEKVAENLTKNMK